MGWIESADSVCVGYFGGAEKHSPFDADLHSNLVFPMILLGISSTNLSGSTIPISDSNSIPSTICFPQGYKKGIVDSILADENLAAGIPISGGIEICSALMGGILATAFENPQNVSVSPTLSVSHHFGLPIYVAD